MSGDATRRHMPFLLWSNALATATVADRYILRVFIYLLVYFLSPAIIVLIESRRLKFVNRLLNHKQCATLFLTDVVY